MILTKQLSIKTGETSFLMNFAGKCALFCILLATGCMGGPKDTGIIMKADRSVNLAIPQDNWPGNPEKTLTIAEQEVYRLKGAPNYIRFWWKNVDDFVERLEVPQKPTPEILAKVKQSWIYLNPDEEIVFDSVANSHPQPVGDRLRVVIAQGDPQERKYLPAKRIEDEIETWHYYRTGMLYRFLNGKLMDPGRRVHPPMPGYNF